MKLYGHSLLNEPSLVFLNYRIPQVCFPQLLYLDWLSVWLIFTLWPLVLALIDHYGLLVDQVCLVMCLVNHWLYLNNISAWVERGLGRCMCVCVKGWEGECGGWGRAQLSKLRLYFTSSWWYPPPLHTTTDLLHLHTVVYVWCCGIYENYEFSAALLQAMMTKLCFPNNHRVEIIWGGWDFLQEAMELVTTVT